MGLLCGWVGATLLVRAATQSSRQIMMISTRGMMAMYLGVALILGFAVISGYSIKCWECRSDGDPKCADPFDNTSFPITDCSHKKPRDHLPGLESTKQEYDESGPGIVH